MSSPENIKVMAKVAKEFLGPTVVGIFFNIFLYGTLLMQAQAYYRHSANTSDPRWLKVVVTTLLLLETANSILAASVVYEYCVSDFGNLPKLLVTTPVHGAMAMSGNTSLGVFTGPIVQVFFASRIKWLTKKTWLGALIIVLAILEALCGIGSITGGIILKEFKRFHAISPSVIAWLVLAALIDVLISGSLVIFLRKNKTGFAATDDILSKITRLTIQTAFVTATCAIVNLIVFLAIATPLHFMFNIPLAKLYANCMLSSLNARTNWSIETKGPQQLSGSERSGVKITTSTGVHRDDIELRHQRVIDASQHRPDNIVELSRGVPSVPVQKGDGLSINSDVDLEEGESKSRSIDNHVSWHGTPYAR